MLKTDFITNNPGGFSQAYDDSIDISFSNNFLMDHDNSDASQDNISDNPYPIDLDSNNIDDAPFALPVHNLKELGLDLEDLVAMFNFKSEFLNLKSLGKYEIVNITLPVGFSVTNLNVSTISIYLEKIDG